jgi:hypothetical protein
LIPGKEIPIQESNKMMHLSPKQSCILASLGNRGSGAGDPER